MKRRVLVTGDILIEWRFAQSVILHATGTTPETSYFMQCKRQESCSQALGSLIDAAAKIAGLEADVVHPEIKEDWLEPGASPYWHTYTLCRPYEALTEDKKVVWRVRQRVGSDRLPLDHAKMKALLDDKRGRSRDHGQAEVVVVEDAYYGFNAEPDLWPRSLQRPRKDAWAVVRWKQPPEGKKYSELWTHIQAQFKDRIILVLSANDLRVHGLRISRELTWERTIEDLDEGLRRFWADELQGCAYLVVSFYGAGAAVFARTRSGYEGRLYFDPLLLQETWSHDAGSMFGYSRCLTAAVTLQLLRMLDNGTAGQPSPQVLGDGIVPGILAQHSLHRGGFDVEEHPLRRNFDDSVPSLLFPIERIAKELALPRQCEPPAQRRDPAKPLDSNPFFVDLAIPKELDGKPAETDRDKWKILPTELANEKDLLREAKSIVEAGIEGRSAEHKYPIACFGEMFATDRTEIESFKMLASLITNYMSVRSPWQHPTRQKPFSIAVFGEPGSGKSFGIQAVAKDAADRQPLKNLTFNLSQLSSPEQINEALHQVRDVGLSGQMPLVFWDEFDAALDNRPLGWLRYFLSPMQDGLFTQGPVTHNVGQAIFVFGGGTHTSVAAFCRTAASDLGKEAKAPDFASRLKGHVDILGLNYAEGKSIEPSVAMRRAVLLHSILKQSGGRLEQTVPRDDRLKKIINIDPGLVYAFLKIPRYEYAARSMEAIVKMSAIAGKSLFERSSLAPSEQMRIHVDAAAFIKLIEQTPPEFLKDGAKSGTP